VVGVGLVWFLGGFGCELWVWVGLVFGGGFGGFGWVWGCVGFCGCGGCWLCFVCGCGWW
jgi:hypothetical protein